MLKVEGLGVRLASGEGLVMLKVESLGVRLASGEGLVMLKAVGGKGKCTHSIHD